MLSCVNNSSTLIEPIVSSMVAYEHMHYEQLFCMKLLRQGSPSSTDGEVEAARNRQRPQASRGLGAWLKVGSTKVNCRFNIVKSNKPKMLTGLDQKVTQLVNPSEFWGYANNITAGVQTGPNPSLLFTRNIVSPYLSYGVGRLTARKTDRGAGIGLQKKRMPLCNEVDKGLNLTLHESGQTSVYGNSLQITFRTF